MAANEIDEFSGECDTDSDYDRHQDYEVDEFSSDSDSYYD